ncbi:MAG TPA: NAD-dependent epimerase/dehydratase family protein, partial [Bryobacteraceae bacterium]|nr:NAD-dependent epimerase/dehydratase family protein [Bryobacteraceae bacterium]
MRILITGGAGFIGSHLTERMLALGHGITVLDDLSTGWIENLRPAFDYSGFQFVEGSVLDASLIGRLVERSDMVIHLAAAVGVRYILEHPLATIKTNVEGTGIVLAACARLKRKVLVASTSEVYGKNSAESLCETADSILGPSSLSRWSYATSKKLDEFLALAYAATHGLPVVVTRFFNIVGPRQTGRYGMVLPNFIQAALERRPIRVFGDGLQSRNFTFIGDCLDAVLLLLDSKQAEGEIVNIGSPHEISILELAERVRSIAGSSSPII